MQTPSRFLSEVSIIFYFYDSFFSSFLICSFLSFLSFLSSADKKVHDVTRHVWCAVVVAGLSDGLTVNPSLVNIEIVAASDNVDLIGHYYLFLFLGGLFLFLGGLIVFS